MLRIPPSTARRLAVASQHLDGSTVTADKPGILAVIRQLGCLQIDPINVVARSPLLVLWSRLGRYDPADLNLLLWQDRFLFEYWAHAASIVLTEDYPLYEPRMRGFARGDSRWEQRVWDWMEANASFRQAILQQLARHGPLFVDQIDVPSDVVPWSSSGWTDSRSTSVMLTFLWEQGEIMVARRHGEVFGLKKQWTLTENHLPQFNGLQPWTSYEVVYQAAQRSLQALGVATANHISNHFIRGRYPGLEGVLAELERDGRVVQVDVFDDGQAWPGPWYVHQSRMALLERLDRGEWQPRTTLLSPFDNLICDRDRLETLFDFKYRSEIYSPKAKRQYGYYVMPILHGDRLVGRLDPKMDRKRRQLQIKAVYYEPEIVMTAELSAAVDQAIAELASFLGADEVWHEN